MYSTFCSSVINSSLSSDVFLLSIRMDSSLVLTSKLTLANSYWPTTLSLAIGVDIRVDSSKLLLANKLVLSFHGHKVLQLYIRDKFDIIRASPAGAPKPRPGIWISERPRKNWGPTDHYGLQQASHPSPETIHIFAMALPLLPAPSAASPARPSCRRSRPRPPAAPRPTPRRDVATAAIFTGERSFFARKTQRRQSRTHVVRSGKRR
jgi:hypothetical protein